MPGVVQARYESCVPTVLEVKDCLIPRIQEQRRPLLIYTDFQDVTRPLGLIPCTLDIYVDHVWIPMFSTIDGSTRSSSLETST